MLCRVQHATAHDGFAWEWFGHGQTRALLPLGEHLSSMGLTVSGAEARMLQELPSDAFAAEIAARYEGRLGAVQLASTRHAHPLVATFAHRLVGRRFALAGDAAVGMHPVTAHGFNLGVSSIERLAASRAMRSGGTATVATRRGSCATSASTASRLPCCLPETQAMAGAFTGERRLAQPVRNALIDLGRHVPPLRWALALAVLDEAPRPFAKTHHLHLASEVRRPRWSIARIGI